MSGTQLNDDVTLAGSSDTYAAAGGADTVFGLSGNDTIFGDGAPGTNMGDYLDGGSDNDRLYGGGLTTAPGGTAESSGNDTLIGAEGDDFLYGSDGADSLLGGDGSDRIDAGSGNDTAYGDDSAGTQGADSILGYDGDDLLFGGSGINPISGGSDGNDTLVGGVGNDSLVGEGGNDVLIGGANADSILGGDGDDLVEGGLGGDTMSGGAGIDTLSYANAGDAGAEQGVYAMLSSDPDPNTQLPISEATGDVTDGFEVLVGSIWRDMLVGSGGNDTIFGGAGDDYVTAGGGADMLIGGADNDTLVGGTGMNFMEGGAGADSLDGGFDPGGDFDWLEYRNSGAAVNVNLATGAASGGDAAGDVFVEFEALGGSRFNDTLTGDSVANWIYGRDGDDLIAGGGGADRLYGDSGSDTLDYSASAAAVTITFADDKNDFSGTGGDAQGDFGYGFEAVIGSSGNDRIIASRNLPQNDILSGGAGDDTLDGGAGNDTLTGSVGNDAVDGGSDNDRVIWATGNGDDTAIGGTGTDTLDISTWTGPNTSTDSLAEGVYGIWTVSGAAGVGATRFFTNGTSTIRASEFEAITCFARGTRIATARGEVAVEDLRLGDLVVTASPDAGLKPILWLGRVTADVARHPRPEAVAPVLVRAGALGRGTPHRDLRVSPDHALFLDGCLVPAKLLLNGTTIVQELWQRRVEYWHVELPVHAVIVSEGALTESYLDDGNRDQFDNGSVMRLFPDFEAPRANGDYDSHACAPVLRMGRRLDVIRARLAAQADEGRRAATA